MSAEELNKQNQIRGRLIAKSISRIDRAIKAGFYIEAIALCDSMITNRVAAIGHYSSERILKFNGVNDAIRAVRHSDIEIFDIELLGDTRDWGSERNATMHGFSKIEDFEGASWISRLKVAKQTALRGRRLVARWIAESKKHKI